MIPSLRQAFEAKGIDPRLGYQCLDVIKNYRRMVLNSISTHHIVPKESGWSEVEYNKKKLIHRKHEGIHTVFGNETTQQKIRSVLEEDQTVLQTWFVSSMEDLISRHEKKGWIFKNGVFRRE